MLLTRTWIPYYLLTLSNSKWFLTRKKKKKEKQREKSLLNINSDQYKTSPMIKDKLHWKKERQVELETHELEKLTHLNYDTKSSEEFVQLIWKYLVNSCSNPSVFDNQVLQI